MNLVGSDMRARLRSIGVFLLLLTGCSRVQVVSVSPAVDLTHDRINTPVHGGTATLITRDGSRILGRHVQVAADTTSWIDPRSGQPRKIATPDLYEISYKSRTGGAVIGFAAGTAIGALFGAGMGYAAGDDPEGEFMSFSAAEKAGMFSALFGAAGAIAGTIYGAQKGVRETYRLQTQVATPRGR